MLIAQYTNERIDILARDAKKKYRKTDMYEIMKVLAHYWSNNKSFGYSFIRNAMGRDRCTF